LTPAGPDRGGIAKHFQPASLGGGLIVRELDSRLPLLYADADIEIHTGSREFRRGGFTSSHFSSLVTVPPNHDDRERREDGEGNGDHTNPENGTGASRTSAKPSDCHDVVLCPPKRSHFNVT